MLAGTIAMLLLGLQGGGTNSRAAADENPDQMICRAPEPVLGSRVAQRRVCRTRAQWRAFEADRAQFRRDLQNAAKDGSIER